MNKIFKRIFSYKMLLIITIVIIVMTFLHCYYNEEPWYTWVIAMISSIVASFLVSAFFQFSLKDEISKEHLSIIEYLNEKNESGIVKYFGSFKDSIEEIRKELVTSKVVDIYLMYGSTILNTLSEEIRLNLIKQGNIINIYLMDENNPFLEALATIWGEKNESYTIDKLKGRIDDSIKLFGEKYKELTESNSLKGELNVFKNIKSPINYSFYLFDDKVYFVPSKNVSTKEHIPFTILAEKTPAKNKNALYNKLKTELEMMKKDDCFIKINFDEK